MWGKVVSGNIVNVGNGEVACGSVRDLGENVLLIVKDGNFGLNKDDSAEENCLVLWWSGGKGAGRGIVHYC